MKIFSIFYLLAGVSFGIPATWWLEFVQYFKQMKGADQKLMKEGIETLKAIEDSNRKIANLQKENMDILNSINEKFDD